jgi:integrase
MECVRLRVKDVVFDKNQIIVREGKGQKDRVTILPASLKMELEEHLRRVKLLHERDLAAGFGDVYLRWQRNIRRQDKNGPGSTCFRRRR